ncbi:MAG TPA: discoidin domain-containing protein [Gemmatimonadaceae bacterium]|nr:discoidin domain-containing protein [Gemmatimonadaceae bacterium]
MRGCRSLLLLALAPMPAAAQTRVLDAFEDVAAWTAAPSDGVSAAIASDSGYRGRGMRVDVDFHGGGGYAVVRRALPITYPENFEFTFWIRGDIPPNNLEFKLIDSTGDNVWWVNRRDFHFPAQWTQVTLKRRHVSFAWGPTRDSTLRRTAALEIAITAGQGGKGSVWLDELAFTPREPIRPYAGTPRLTASAALPDAPARLALDGDSSTAWRTAAAGAATLTVDFGQVRELGGVVLRWAPGRQASRYAVLSSPDTVQWDTAYVMRGSDGGRDYVQMPETEARYLRLALATGPGDGYALREIDVRPLAFGASLNALWFAVARDAPRGSYPQAFTDSVQSYWTITGAPAADREAMIDEQGAVEVGKARFALTPYLAADGRLLTWADARRTPGLVDGYLPIPELRWDVDSLALTTTAFVAGAADSAVLFVRYRVRNPTDHPRRVTLHPAVRPFQVNPPWQFLNTTGGAAEVRTVEYANGVVRVNGGRDSTMGDVVVPVTRPAGFGAASFDAGGIMPALRADSLPPSTSASDALGRAGGALAYPLALAAHDSADVVLAVPFAHAPMPPVALAADSAARLAADRLAATRAEWVAKLDRVQLDLPPAAGELAGTVKTTLGYILVNQDGPRIQPGSRSYERSWIRDGALTSYALLRLGLTEPVRAFLEWYAPFQYPNGKVPCCVDHRGADPVPENDSHGELIFAIAEYVRSTGDTAFARRMWPHVVKAVGYMDSLRASRMTPVYRTDSVAFYGLLPQSISHEGYSAKPMHSFWDQFLAVRGYKDAAWLARVVGDGAQAESFARERDAFIGDVVASLRRAMAMHDIGYLPGSVELGDFDPTSTTVGVSPGGLLGTLPDSALRRTFAMYVDSARARAAGTRAWDAYVPYEWRNVGVLVRLGRVDDALALADFLMDDRRPEAWHEWAEVVWRDSTAPKFIGDMPHTWAGSDFIRSVLDLFAYEREADSSLVVTAGIPDRWLEGGHEVAVRGLRTWYGPLDVSVRRGANGATRVTLGGLTRLPPGGIVVRRPDGREVVVRRLGEVVVGPP